MATARRRPPVCRLLRAWVLCSRDSWLTVLSGRRRALSKRAHSSDTDLCRCVQSGTVWLRRSGYTGLRGVVPVASDAVLCRLSAVRLTACLRHANAIRLAMFLLSHVPALVGHASTGRRSHETRHAECAQLTRTGDERPASAVFGIRTIQQKERQNVSFTVGEGPKGPRAENVNVR